MILKQCIILSCNYSKYITTGSSRQKYSFPRGPVRCRGLDRSVYQQYLRSMSNWFKSGGSNSAMIVIIINGKQSVFFYSLKLPV